MLLIALLAGALVVCVGLLVILDPGFVAQQLSSDGTVGEFTLLWLDRYRSLVWAATVACSAGIVVLLVARRRAPRLWRAAHRLGARLLIAMAASLLTLTLCEVTLRSPWAPDPARGVSSRDDQVGYSTRYLASVHDQLNELGLRDAPFPGGDRPDLPRVVFLGDSWVFGFGLPEPAQALPQLLQYTLGQQGTPARVYNAGVPGDNTVDEARRARRLHRSHEPDLVLLGYHLNDAETTDARARYFQSKRLLPLISDQLSPRSKLWSLVEDRACRLGWGLSYVEYLQQLYTAGSESMQRHERELETLVENVRSSGSRFAVVIFPALEQLDAYPLDAEHRRVAAVFERLDVPCLDFLDTFRGRDETELHVSRIDHHCNAEGLRELVVPLTDFLRQESLLPAGD